MDSLIDYKQTNSIIDYRQRDPRNDYKQTDSIVDYNQFPKSEYENFIFKNPSLKRAIQILFDTNNICLELKSIYRRDTIELEDKCYNTLMGKRSVLDFRRREQFDIESLVYSIQQKIDYVASNLIKAEDFSLNKEGLKKKLLLSLHDYKKILSNIKLIIKNDADSTGIDYFEACGSYFETSSPPPLGSKSLKNSKITQNDHLVNNVLKNCLKYHIESEQKYKRNLGSVSLEKTEIMETAKREIELLKTKNTSVLAELTDVTEALARLKMRYDESKKEWDRKINALNQELNSKSKTHREVSNLLDNYFLKQKKPIPTDFETPPQFFLPRMSQSKNESLFYNISSTPEQKVERLIQHLRSTENMNQDLKEKKEGLSLELGRASGLLESIILNYYHPPSATNGPNIISSDNETSSSRDLNESLCSQCSTGEAKNKSGKSQFPKTDSKFDDFNPSSISTPNGSYIISTGNWLKSPKKISDFNLPTAKEEDPGGKADDSGKFSRLLKKAPMIDKITALSRIMDALINDVRNTKLDAKEKLSKYKSNLERHSKSQTNYRELSTRYKTLKSYLNNMQQTIILLAEDFKNLGIKFNVRMDILNPENMPEEIKAIFILPDPDPDRNFVDNTSYRLREHLSDSDLSTNKNSKTWALSESKYLYGRESVERGKGITQNSKSMQVSQNSIDGSYDIVTKTKTSGYHSDSFTYLPPPPPPSIPILPPSLPPTSPLTLKPSKNSFEIGTKKYHEDGYELIITNADLEGYITNSIAPNKTSAHSLPKSSAITASQCLADFSASQKAAFIDRKLSPLYQPMEDHYFDSDKTPDGYYSIDIKKSAVKFFSPVTMFSPPNSPVKQGSKPTGVLLSLYDHTEKHGCDCCLKYPEIRKILNLSYFEQPSDTECMNRMILDQKKEKKENETSRLNATLNDTKRGSKIRRYSDIVEDILARHIKNRHKSG